MRAQKIVCVTDQMIIGKCTYTVKGHTSQQGEMRRQDIRLDSILTSQGFFELQDLQYLLRDMRGRPQVLLTAHRYCLYTHRAACVMGCLHLNERARTRVEAAALLETRLCIFRCMLPTLGDALYCCPSLQLCGLCTSEDSCSSSVFFRLSDYTPNFCRHACPTHSHFCLVTYGTCTTTAGSRNSAHLVAALEYPHPFGMV